MKDHFFKPLLLSAALGISAGAQAAYTVRMNLIDSDGVGKSIGQVTISESEYGTATTTPISRDRRAARASASPVESLSRRKSAIY